MAEAKKLKVTYVRSRIGYNKKQAQVLEALGLKKLNSSNILPDNEAVRGMIFKVNHLLKVENIK
jgi:large subunit ribosomal protein L30